mgnify:CR=1 FL=1
MKVPFLEFKKKKNCSSDVRADLFVSVVSVFTSDPEVKRMRFQSDWLENTDLCLRFDRFTTNKKHRRKLSSTATLVRS